MTLYGYCYFNRKGGFYTAPFFVQYSKDVELELVERSYKVASPEEKTFLYESDFMYLGQFDDHSGEFALQSKPVFLRNFVEETKDVQKE